MTYFIGYDISNSEHRIAIAKILENHGIRIQYSFFYCELEPKQMENLFQQLSAVLDPQYDSLHIYPVCKNCLKSRRTLGNNPFSPDPPYRIL